MRVLCIGRHLYLSEHLCRFFEELGVDASPCVGMSEAAARIRAIGPDAVICDYDLLATIPIASWETDPDLRTVPVVAVSMTRHPGEVHLCDVNGVAGFLYLPTLEPDDAHRLLAAVTRKRGRGINPPPDTLPWPSQTPVAQLR